VVKYIRRFNMNAFEIGILEYILNHFHNGFLDKVVPILTKLGDGGIFWIAVAIILLLFKKTRPVGLAVTIALVIDVLLCNVMLKPIIARTRPYDVVNGGSKLLLDSLLIKAPTDFSFPSGHTTVSFAPVGAMVFKKSKLWIPSLIIATLLGLSRLYLTVHYPTDVIVGAILGFGFGIAGYFIAKWLEKKIPEKVMNFSFVKSEKEKNEETE
jgi:undecaprenyl-diphosphatase